MNLLRKFTQYSYSRSPFHHHRPGAVSRVVWPMVALLAFSHILPAEEAGVTASAPNAAVDYWKAVSFMRTARAPEDLTALAYVETEMVPLPPTVFRFKSKVARWLLEDSASLAALSEGSRAEVCDFNVRSPDRTSLDLSHLAAIRALTHRVLQVAKAYQYVENPEGAADIYVSLLGMATHLDQDENFASALLAAEIIQQTLVELEGFLTRKPSPAAVSVLTRYFAEAPPQVFHMGDYLRASAAHYANWLSAPPERLEQNLKALYGNAKDTPVLDLLGTLDSQSREEHLTNWVEDYRARMTALASAADKPYQIGLYALLDLDKEKAAVKRKRPLADANPLVSLLVPTMSQTYERLLLAEAQFGMADVLCAAALYRAELKKWPKDIGAAGKFVGRQFRRDPFSGQVVQYALQKKLPVLGIRAPKWIDKQEDLVNRLDLADRLKWDERLTDEVEKAVNLQKRREKMIERQKAKAEKKKKKKK